MLDGVAAMNPECVLAMVESLSHVDLWMTEKRDQSITWRFTVARCRGARSGLGREARNNT